MSLCRSLPTLVALTALFTLDASVCTVAGKPPLRIELSCWRTGTRSLSVLACSEPSDGSGVPPRNATSVASRSFCRSFTTPVSCAPSLASCWVRLNWLALFSASATRSPPKTSPMRSAATITAKSRRATGQSVNVTFICRFRLESTSVDLPARRAGISARGRMLAPWVPINQSSPLEERCFRTPPCYRQRRAQFETSRLAAAADTAIRCAMPTLVRLWVPYTPSYN